MQWGNRWGLVNIAPPFTLVPVLEEEHYWRRTMQSQKLMNIEPLQLFPLMLYVDQGSP